MWNLWWSVVSTIIPYKNMVASKIMKRFWANSRNGKKENETPGKYASGTIVANYTSGQTIDVAVKITANHKGWFEFKLCEFDLCIIDSVPWSCVWQYFFCEAKVYQLHVQNAFFCLKLCSFFLFNLVIQTWLSQSNVKFCLALLL